MKERILQLIEAKQLTNAAFADEIGVQRSTLSHIKTGRSEPSLDIVQKILLRYPEVNSDWLILGQGTMFCRKSDSREPKLFDDFDVIDSYSAINEPKMPEKSVPIPPQTVVDSGRAVPPMSPRAIERVIIFYNDGTFEEIIKC